MSSSIMTILNTLESLETGMMNVYAWFGEVFSEDKELSQFFKKMSHEESGHKSLVNYQKNLVRKNPKMFSNVPVDMGELELMIRKIDDMLIKKPDISEESALSFSLNMESYASEGLYKTLIIASCPELKDLIDNLTKHDDEHFERLRQFAQERLKKIPE